jgi:NlpC/P60 family/Bacterial dipeptidyl-peptidase Sh3 domain
MTGLDKRLFAFRPDLADARLMGRCEAAQFAEGIPAQCAVPVAGVFRSPADDAMQVSQMLLGESLLVFEQKNGWSWVQLDGDNYVGYVRDGALRDAKAKRTHHVCVLSSHLYPKPDIKTQPAIAVPMMSQLCALDTTGDFHALASGRLIYKSHASSSFATDFVAVAEQFLHAPYLWGGKTAWGIDCSGLVQIALHACGRDAPRDSDMQEQGLGQDVTGEKLKRGDLIFWKGHVGILRDAETLLHANGHHMQVVSEPLETAMARIAAKGFPVTSIKRL